MMPYKVFLVYPKEIAQYRKELVGQFAAFERAGMLECWYDEKIPRGEDWDTEIIKHLEAADMVLLFTCAEFFMSDFICEKELPLALRMREEKRAVVIPILVSPVNLAGPVAAIASLPNNRKPVTTWPDRTQAWADVVYHLKKYFNERLTNHNDNAANMRPWQQDSINACLELRPFNAIKKQIAETIDKADSIWVLCRTGLGLWNDFGSELGRLYLSHPDSRLIVIDPQGEAFRSTRHEWIPWHLERTQPFDDYQSRSKTFLENLCSTSQRETIRKLNILLPLVVLIVNPGAQDNSRTMMFIEYPTNGSAGKFTHGGYQEKPWLKVTKQDHPAFYQGFHGSFLEFWKQAEPLCPI